MHDDNNESNIVIMHGVIVDKNQMTIGWLNNAMNYHGIISGDDYRFYENNFIVEKALYQITFNMPSKYKSSLEVGNEISRFLTYYTNKNLTENTMISEFINKNNHQDYVFAYADEDEDYALHYDLSDYILTEDLYNKKLSDMVNIPELWFTKNDNHFSHDVYSVIGFIDLLSRFDVDKIKPILISMNDYHNSSNPLLRAIADIMVSEIQSIRNKQITKAYEYLTRMILAANHLIDMLNSGWMPSINQNLSGFLGLDDEYGILHITELTVDNNDYDGLTSILAYKYITSIIHKNDGFYNYKNMGSYHEDELIRIILENVNMPIEFIDELIIAQAA